MTIAQSLLPEFDQEMANTRICLERVENNKLEFSPDPKSMTLGRLAGHIAEIPGWVAVTLNTPELDFDAGGYKPVEIASREQILEIFDKNVSEARSALAGVSDEQLMVDWTLRGNGQVYFKLPRIGVLRGMVLSHMIHHRGQLTVYLRMVGAKVPGVYGPSADDTQTTVANAA